MHLCSVLDELGRHVEAETLFRQACANDPSQAEAYFRWMLHHDEAHAPTLVNLALLHMQDHRWAEAEPLLRQAIEHAPDDARILRWYGIVLTELGQLGRAEGSLRQALELAPDDDVARGRLATLLWSEGRRDEGNRFAARGAVARACQRVRAHRVGGAAG